MPVTTHVARKNHGPCEVCSKDTKKGMSYTSVGRYANQSEKDNPNIYVSRGKRFVKVHAECVEQLFARNEAHEMKKEQTRMTDKWFMSGPSDEYDPYDKYDPSYEL